MCHIQMMWLMLMHILQYMCKQPLEHYFQSTRNRHHTHCNYP
jgi:hypothetical protein